MPVTPSVPHTIGRYRILEVLGAGGMGTVYKAEQRLPVKRVVALKLIKPGFDSEQVVARFQSERQALARMDHPHIARILDGGADDERGGRPYFVLEYVPGVPITTFCDANKLSVRDRLLLFVQACQAIAHAHTKAILHRDVKPSNVLAYLQDGVPTVKVIDFGIAKALTGERLTDRTLNTGLGAMIGTYESMSPEQAEGSPDIDTRTDVYSLGVLLYELLTGSPPYDRESLARAGDAEVRRIIREREPPRPGTRLSSMAQPTARAVAAARQARLEQLARELQGELEWIPLKAMRKERDRRYASALQLAEDVRRYLDHRPLIAGPESWTYRAGKFARKHRVPMAAAAVLVLTLVAGLLSSSLLYVRAERALVGERQSRALADARRREAQEQRAAATAARAAADLNAYAAGIAAAQAALASNDLQAARRHLLAAPEPLRGFEWQLLWASLDDSAATLYGHAGTAFCTAFSRDGARLASGGADGNVLVFDARSGERVQTLLGHFSDVRGIAFSPDGARLAAASQDGKVRVWHVEEGKLLHEITDPDGTCRAVEFHPRSGQLLTGTAKGNVHVWDLAAAAGPAGPVRTLAVPRGGFVYAMALSADGERLAVGTKTNHAVFDTVSGALLHRSRDDQETSDIAISSDGTRVAYTGGGGHKAFCFELGNPKLQIFMGIGMSVEAGLRGMFVLTSRENVFVADAATGQTHKTLRCGDVQVSYIGTSISPDRRTLAAGTLDGRVLLLRLDLEDPLGGWGGGNALRVLSPDATRLLCAQFDGVARVLAVGEHFREVARFQAHPNAMTSGRFSPDGRAIATAGDDNVVKLWDAHTGAPLRELRGHGPGVRAVAFSPDGAQLVSAGGDGELFIWPLDAAAQEPIRRALGPGRALTAVAYSPAGATIAAAAEDGEIFILQPPADGSGPAGAGAAVRRLSPHTQPVFGLCFSSDGRTLLSCAGDGLALMSDPLGARPPVRLEGHTRTVACAAFSPDGRRVFTGAFDGTVRIWDAATGRELLKLPSAGFTHTLAPFADGQRVMVGNWHSTSSIDLMPLARRVAAPVGEEVSRALRDEPAAAAVLRRVFARPGLSAREQTAAEVAVLVHGSARAADAYRRVAELFERPSSLPEVLQQLESDRSLDSGTRAVAMRLARSCAAEARHLYARSWPRVRDRTQQARWPQALEDLRAACRQLPDSAEYHTALGLAQYRLGRIDEAVATLSRVPGLERVPRVSDFSESIPPPRPALLAGLAMALHHKGMAAQAAPYYERLRQLAADPRWSGDPEFIAFFAEARDVLGKG